MSFSNRVEDVEAIKDLKVGDYYYFNMFQGGGCEVHRVDINRWDLYEVPLYGGVTTWDSSYTLNGIGSMVDLGYSWI